MRYIGFIDMLGTKHRAEHDPADYYSSVRQFQEVVVNFSPVLHRKGAVHVFSDCAYVEANNIKSILDYLRKVRQQLLSSGYYLKGAVSSGDLEARPAYESTTVDDPAIQVKRKETVQGTLFGPKAAPVYSLQEKLKGIGIHIDMSLEAQVKNESVLSCHFPGATKGESFLDIVFEESTISSDLLEAVMRNLINASTAAHSHSFARYFFSLIISWIRSSDFSAMRFNAIGGDAKESQTPQIYNALMRSMFVRRLSDLHGVEVVFLSLLDKILLECPDENVRRHVTEKVLQRRKAVRALQSLPKGILSSGSRDSLERYLAKSLVSPQRSTKD